MATILSPASPRGSEERREPLTPYERESRIRRRAGCAYARLQTTGTRLASTLGVTDAVITNRKAGQGGLANVLIEVAAMERAGIDTTPIAEAILDQQIESRNTEQLSLLDLAMCEQEVDAAEDKAQIAYLTGKGSPEEWAASLRTYIARAWLTARTVSRA